MGQWEGGRRLVNELAYKKGMVEGWVEWLVESGKVCGWTHGGGVVTDD